MPTTKKSYLERIEGHATKIRADIEAGLRKIEDEREAVVREVAEDLHDGRRKHEDAEKALHAAQNEVSELKRGRERNMNALNSATLDDDQTAIKEAQKREKERKRDLAAAEKGLSKAQANFAAVKTDPDAEASGARGVKVDADRGLERVLRDLEAAASKAVSDANISEGRRDDHGINALAQKVRTRGEKSAGWDDEKMRWRPSPEQARRNEAAASMKEKYLG